MISSTIEQLRAMKMNAFASELERQIKDADSYKQLGFEDRLTLLVDAEWNRRQNNKLDRYIRNARFSDANATIEGIEYIEDRHLDKGKMLRLSTCNYVDEGRHIILRQDHSPPSAHAYIYNRYCWQDLSASCILYLREYH